MIENAKESSHPRILVVDDEPRMVRFIVMNLEHAQLDVDFASTGEVALNKLSENNYDVMLLDFTLAGEYGLALIESIRNLGIGIPIILVSASLGEERVEACKKAGANGFIEKPFSPRELIEYIYKILDRSARKYM